MAIKLATKVSKMNKELTLFSKTKILKALKISVKAIKNKEYFKNLIKKIAMFDVQVNDSVNNFSPKVIAKYSYDLAVTFSSFYEHVKVLKSETPELLNARLCLVVSFQKTLKSSLGLLGIDAPERM